MKTRSVFVVAVALGAASLSMGCKGAPASPFNSLEEAPMTIYRLQNTQQQQAAPAAAAPGAMQSPIPGLPIPPQFQQQAQQAQKMICGVLPPGTPGCAPGGAAPGMTPQMPAAGPMFEGYKVLGQAQVLDPKLRKELIDVFGYEKSFGPNKSPCMFPEIGVQFGAPGPQPTADVLISFSCNQVQGRNFQWPHPNNGLTDKSTKKLTTVVGKVFGGA